MSLFKKLALKPNRNQNGLPIICSHVHIYVRICSYFVNFAYKLSNIIKCSPLCVLPCSGPLASAGMLYPPLLPPQLPSKRSHVQALFINKSGKVAAEQKNYVYFASKYEIETKTIKLILHTNGEKEIEM